MAGVGTLTEAQMVLFALLFLRMVGFIVAMPIIGTGAVPVQVKVLLSVTLALMMMPHYKTLPVGVDLLSENLILLAAREVFVGVFLGFLMRMFFFTIAVAGDLIGMSSGLASAQMFNPMMGSQGNVMEQFYSVVATLFFFGINGHHIFLGGLIKSLELIPVMDLSLNLQSMIQLVDIFQTILVIGIKLASPVVVAILFTNLAMGVLGKAVPQMNILLTSVQVTFIVTLFVLILTVPFFVEEMSGVLNQMAETFHRAMQVL